MQILSKSAKGGRSTCQSLQRGGRPAARGPGFPAVLPDNERSNRAARASRRQRRTIRLATFDRPPISLDLSSLSAAIVDLDGTLVDTVGDFEQALARTLGDLGLPPVDRAFIARTVGRGSMNLLRETLAHVGGAPALLDEAWTHYQIGRAHV